RVPCRSLRRIQSPATTLDGLNVALDAVEVTRVDDVSRLPARSWILPPLRCGAHDSSPHDGNEKAALSAAGKSCYCALLYYRPRRLWPRHVTRRSGLLRHIPKGLAIRLPLFAGRPGR